MDWENIDLENRSHLNILDGISFDDILLIADCNIKDVNEDTVRKEFEELLQRRIDDAKDVFECNLSNIVKRANDV